ncbi:MAG: tRNA (adenosine(37)-N6)-threonylcarbamoyltransferase complex dimerization subunit type 1 TsaB [Polyangiaceae bacterium]|nr:tRNA (adenosine(37)-N6)-threonylcarbamoyltransferase complex dimerization subunit type 1 TsaB [Polyangiaceae bacterium]
MRLLCIETSSRRGSVVLAEGPQLVVRATHAEPNAHAERLRPLLDQVLAEAGWHKTQIDRLGVGMGPGSFTGLRVGIAFAQGIALGLDRPLIGVGSLEAMAAGCPPTLGWPRIALLDARRDEVFVQAFAEGGQALAPAEALPRASALRDLAARYPAATYLGEMAAELGAPAVFRAEITDLPDATGVAALVAFRDPDASLREPLYVRDSGATPQNLPPSPIRGRAG